MQYNELYQKYNELKKENEALRIENDRLRKLNELYINENKSNNDEEISIKENLESYEERLEETELNQKLIISNTSAPREKIMLFMSLFKGRNDVYAKRWESDENLRPYEDQWLFYHQ